MITNTGKLSPSPKQYRVIDNKGHYTLSNGDIVVVAETQDRRHDFWLVRVSDFTLHSLQNDYDAYIDVEEIE
jgi:exosome complex RNA-binding protein Rrp4